MSGSINIYVRTNQNKYTIMKRVFKGKFEVTDLKQRAIYSTSRHF